MLENTAPSTAGRVCLSIVGSILPFSFVADLSASHLFNPKWTPHAKFHNGQTMSLSAILCVATIYYTWRPDSSPNADSVRTAAIMGSMYWIAGLSAYFYPGTLPVDPEFGSGYGPLPLFAALAALAWTGYWLEARRMAELKVA